MLNSIQETQQLEFSHLSVSGVLAAPSARREAYDRDSHKVYAIAFWMTGNELAAEDLMAETFRSAFSETVAPTEGEVDQALVQQLRKEFQLPVFTLACQPSIEVKNVRQNTLRVELERAVIELPATEKLIFIMHDIERYDHERITRLLGITERESRLGLHQARLRVRELLSK
jgi:RNA polymerase sigma-70 factor (ECF subfamily)